MPFYADLRDEFADAYAEAQIGFANAPTGRVELAFSTDDDAGRGEIVIAVRLPMAARMARQILVIAEESEKVAAANKPQKDCG